MSAVYLVFCRLLELVVLLGRRQRTKELKIIVLRHKLSILRQRLAFDLRLLVSELVSNAVTQEQTASKNTSN